MAEYLSSAQASFETILSLLSSVFVPEDDDVFMRWVGKALKDERLRTEIDEWRREWVALVRDGKEAGVLL